MRMTTMTLALALLAGCAAAPRDAGERSITSDPSMPAIAYPEAARGDTVDTYHGVTVADPYRWMEDLDSPDLARWIAEQNALTETVIARATHRDAIRARVAALTDFERFGVPLARNGRYFFTRNDGLQNQSPLYWQTGLDGEPRLLIDPNVLSADGTSSLADWQPNDDGTLVAWAKSDGGSDWRTIRVRDVASGRDLPDVIEWAKFTQIAWLPDSSGFYYSRYDAPAPGGDVLKSVNRFQKIFFHRLGTPQSDDALVFERRDQPEWGLTASVSDDGSKFVINVSKGTDERNLLFFKDLSRPGQPVRELIAEFAHQYEYVGSLGNEVFVRTDDAAERYRVIAIDLDKPGRDAWREVIPEQPATLTEANLVGDQLIGEYLADARSEVRAWRVDGTQLRTLALPGLGTAVGFAGSARSRETFFSFASFTQPAAIWRYDVRSGEVAPFRAPTLNFDPQAFETRQVFYTASDGTRIPLFIVARRDVVPNGRNPTLLYAYGGFNIPISPSFSAANIAWMEMGGVYALANIRGGGEYGRAWHEAAMGVKRPRAFDDFADAARYLISEQWTAPARLAISGRSNGGLLVAATLLRNPELFGAALPAVGVLDMLRFREFTIGWAWESDYGSVKNVDEFRALKGYSPLHNVRAGVEYPWVMIQTADRDDRVFPAHSFKFAAELQHTATSSRPMLIRTETRAGHGAGKPTQMIIDEAADVFAFLSVALDINAAPDATAPAAPGAID